MARYILKIEGNKATLRDNYFEKTYTATINERGYAESKDYIAMSMIAKARAGKLADCETTAATEPDQECAWCGIALKNGRCPKCGCTAEESQAHMDEQV